MGEETNATEPIMNFAETLRDWRSGPRGATRVPTTPVCTGATC